ncbi:hypothetical protein O9K51_10143 [Purpureocillium lavendulum]|uniref:Uncharacterized protein n=1 Tax=Purpureocillium lavendulum TaxID=1247861 RepID=A0AB34FCL9_9HYPO|nr:hypothetical protein O9K51_10143 [Purpureocillium lavendulum]
MNWNEGSLSRHTRGRGRNDDETRQRQHFANARTNSLAGAATSMAANTAAFVPDYIPQPAAEQAQSQDTGAAAMKPEEDNDATVREDEMELDKAPKEHTYEQARQQLLNRSDWAGVGSQQSNWSRPEGVRRSGGGFWGSARPEPKMPRRSQNVFASETMGPERHDGLVPGNPPPGTYTWGPGLMRVQVDGDGHQRVNSRVWYPDRYRPEPARSEGVDATPRGVVSVPSAVQHPRPSRPFVRAAALRVRSPALEHVSRRFEEGEGEDGDEDDRGASTASRARSWSPGRDLPCRKGEGPSPGREQQGDEGDEEPAWREFLFRGSPQRGRGRRSGATGRGGRP